MPEPNPAENPGVLLATELVRELVLLREVMVDLRDVILENTKAADQLAGYFDVVSRTVDLLGGTGRKPNWNDFLDCWAQAEREILDDGDEDEEEGGEPPVPTNGGGGGPVRRRRIVENS